MKKVLFRFVPFVLATSFICTACKKDTQQPSTYYGPAVTLGNGNVRSYITIGTDNHPQSIGLRLTENALTGLTNDTTNMEALMTSIDLPSQAQAAGYNHVEIDWNPYGHDPAFYRVPHFDFHFYLIRKEEQAAITGGPDSVSVPAPYIPQDYFSTVDAVPDMGVHWIDSNAPELHGQPFTDTFIYGFYHGNLIFFEPMITLATIDSKEDVHLTVKQPQAFQRSGYFPTEQNVHYDSQNHEYVISLDGLVKH
jgi:hypothetical protein